MEQRPAADPRGIRFYNLLDPAAAREDDGEFVASGDPAVRLDNLGAVGRNELQARLLRDCLAGVVPAPDPDLLAWAYCRYAAQMLAAGSPRAGEPPLGDAPVQPEVPAHWRERMVTAATSARAGGSHPDGAPNLILFNVLVALEWHPDSATLRQLEWGFRRASDFLYDVTDGHMAFGQVVFLDDRFLGCADIQIMTSNRFHPRSWVSGLHDSAKFRPIRLGRGLWQQRHRITIPWDEPEAYRPLVHEWAHYALDQKDQYLQRRRLIAASEIGLAGVPPQLLLRPARSAERRGGRYSVVVQRVADARPSIMASLVGTSELAAAPGGRSGEGRKLEEWEKIAERFGIAQPTTLLAGPERLPLPLPVFWRRLDTAERTVGLPAPREAPAALAGIPQGIPLDRCWLYLVRDLGTARARLIAQGTFEARSAAEPFRLLGARAGDLVVLVADAAYGRTAAGDAPTVVLTGEITAEGRLDRWHDGAAARRRLPTIRVLPDVRDLDPHDHLAPLRVRIDSHGATHPDEVWLFPLGQSDGAVRFQPDPEQPVWVSGPQPLATLDGHVLLRWRGEPRDALFVCAFSQGGGPPSHDFAPIPISAGSSDGDVQLFFHTYDRGMSFEEQKGHSATKVVTTINDGAVGTPPRSGARPWSVPFALASNRRLPGQFVPTLVVHYMPPDERMLLTGDLLICRLQGGAWRPQPTYLPAGAAYAAMPMVSAGAGGTSPGGTLLDPPPPEGASVEHYRLYWIPRDR